MMATRWIPAPPRRRGRPKLAAPMVRTSVRLPAEIFDAYCQVALRRGDKVPQVIRQALEAQLQPRR